MNLSMLPVAVLLIALMVGGGYYKGHSSGFAAGSAAVQQKFDTYKAEQEHKYAEAVIKHRDAEQQMQATADTEREKNRAKVGAINKQLAGALDELRKRPERRAAAGDGQMSNPPQACTGVSGAELARGDAGFLVGYSADAAKQREALRTCETQYNEVRAELLKE